MNYVYDPKVQGLMEAGDPKRNITGIYYIRPVAGAGSGAKKYDPSVAKNTLIFPTKKMLDSVKIFDSNALNNQKYLHGLAEPHLGLASVVGFFHRHRNLTPYLLLAPGILWLERVLRRPARLPGLPVAPVRELRRRLFLLVGLG